MIDFNENSQNHWLKFMKSSIKMAKILKKIKRERKKPHK